MQTENKSKLFWILGLVLLIILVVYLATRTYNPPYQTLTPENYPPGTTVSLYKGIPSGFPSGIMQESVEVADGNIVTSAEGKVQITFSYNSVRPLADVIKMYKTSLLNDGWKLVVNGTNEKVATILATDELEKLIVTMVPMGAGTIVTFQYEK